MSSGQYDDWPKDSTAYNMAQEVLVLASIIKVPHQKNTTEMAMQPLVDASNCCLLLAMADKYGTMPLRAYCVFHGEA